MRGEEGGDERDDPDERGEGEYGGEGVDMVVDVSRADEAEVVCGRSPRVKPKL